MRRWRTFEEKIKANTAEHRYARESDKAKAARLGRRAQAREQYLANREQILEDKAQYYQDNKEAVKERVNKQRRRKREEQS